MYEIRFDDDRWIVAVEKSGAFQGSLPLVMSYCEHYLNFDRKELDIALDEMVKNKHDGAHFGIAKKFIFTFKAKDKPLKDSTVIYGVH